MYIGIRRMDIVVFDWTLKSPCVSEWENYQKFINLEQAIVESAFVFK